MTSLLSERIAVIGRIKPQTVTAAATAESGVVDMQYWDRVLVLADIGDYAAGNDGTVTGGVYGDTASNGSFATLITGKEVTTSKFSGSAQDDAVGEINIKSDEVNAQGFRYIKVKMTPANQNLTLACMILGGDGRYEPASDFDMASVKEIIE